MGNNELDEKLHALIKSVDGLPESEKKKLLPLMEETKKRHEQIRKTTESAMEALADFRLNLTYELFDIEASERERKQ